MTHFTRILLTAAVPLVLFVAACGASDGATSDSAISDSAASDSAASDSATSDSAISDSATSDSAASDSAASDSASTERAPAETTSTPEAEATALPETAGSVDGDAASLFIDGALTSDAAVVDCTLENGSETTCYQIEVASLASTVDTDGPFCPGTTSDVGGIWVWDGDQPGLYALDAAFWALMTAQGYDFVDADGNISITDPGTGAADSSGTGNSCLQATPDGSFHLQVLLPTAPENLDTPTDLSTVSQIGVALDGVTIFGDAPSVADRGGLPALDACGGHIDPSGYYHWHFGAESIQTNLDEARADVTCSVKQDPEALIGFAFDGYGIYGPEEDRAIPSDLDACSGHVSETAEFGAIYHYHLTYDSPNLPTCRVGAAATGKLTSPDNAAATLPDGGVAGGGPPPRDGAPAGPPPGDGAPGAPPRGDG